jgi:acyl carrier protein
LSQDESLVRRQQLPLPKPYAAPRSDTEQKIAEIWRDALTMDTVGVDDSYNDLGGDSTTAAIIFALIEETFAIKIPMATLINAPTIAQLAPIVDKLAKAPQA